MATDVTEGLRRIARQIRHGSEEYGREAAEYGREAAQYGRESARELRRRRDDTRAELARLWAQLEDVMDRRIVPAARDASREASHYARGGREAAVHATERLRDVTRANPLLALGVAAAATFVVASLLRGRR